MLTEKSTKAFLRRLVKRGSNECWPWTWPMNWDGYGRFKGRAAHRASFEIHNGQIPRGLIVMHTCDNRACCNPAHLRVGTQSDNMQDCASKGRLAKHHAKVSREQERYIVTMRGMGYTNGEIAPMFGIKKHAVSMILARVRKRG